MSLLDWLMLIVMNGVGVFLILKGLWGILFKEAHIHLKGEEAVTIEGKWAVIASIAYIIFGSSIPLSFVIGTTTTREEEFICGWCGGAIIIYLILFIASREGIRAKRIEY